MGGPAKVTMKSVEEKINQKMEELTDKFKVMIDEMEKRMMDKNSSEDAQTRLTPQQIRQLVEENFQRLNTNTPESAAAVIAPPATIHAKGLYSTVTQMLGDLERVEVLVTK